MERRRFDRRPSPSSNRQTFSLNTTSSHPPNSSRWSSLSTSSTPSLLSQELRHAREPALPPTTLAPPAATLAPRFAPASRPSKLVIPSSRLYSPAATRVLLLELVVSRAERRPSLEAVMIITGLAAVAARLFTRRRAI
ncbi:hypothetical protein FVEG_11909 [Fusarium verticillioides 7600]|uniref:Uncharacterized protein n=1 Tax=Gibberella moniliformis (strain M3125 / FGSC 7600) TaxID=334819 RepID=W7MPX4_GIBM7|nr:hypothetical protein FVEG_11909 [Fusarium verticillioides 7600]XP_018759678.1 hypothetical protein FVEG_11909 [Fusarium verticillioides 7600]XP_018759679.1 hypothetical protein FVEG_11909 [Fusarium verticillioides 7600]EWG53486.1 hypothetical protein FVEG_11909 [Fusarium verticillioides 7600]EWG53487.1 hypothetical protein FVEG_11909 [Fusarium verticillioides 7600]EWG53488.1 hypothetical protein FVEG_11909 [Fusarium verticillioides 7600]